MPKQHPEDDEQFQSDDEALTRAFEEHDPTLEPFASMGRDEILALMHEAETLLDWARLEQFLHDKMTLAELRTSLLGKKLGMFLAETWEARGTDQHAYLYTLAGEIATRIGAEIPPPPVECN